MGMGNGDLFKSTTLIKIAAFTFLAVAFFYFGKHWSDAQQQPLVFFDSRQGHSSPTAADVGVAVSLSPNVNKTFDLASMINDTASGDGQEHKDDGKQQQQQQQRDAAPQPPPPPALQRMGVVDENGVMAEEFEVGEFDPGVVDNWGQDNATDADEGGGDRRIRVKKFALCSNSFREYIPCLDNVEAIKQLKSTEKGEKFERHCPEKDKGLNCLVPAPRGYRTPIPWPRSRDEV